MRKKPSIFEDILLRGKVPEYKEHATKNKDSAIGGSVASLLGELGVGLPSAVVGGTVGYSAGGPLEKFLKGKDVNIDEDTLKVILGTLGAVSAGGVGSVAGRRFSQKKYYGVEK